METETSSCCVLLCFPVSKYNWETLALVSHMGIHSLCKTNFMNMHKVNSYSMYIVKCTYNLIYLLFLTIKVSSAAACNPVCEHCFHCSKTWQLRRKSLFTSLCQSPLISNGCSESQTQVNNLSSVHMEFHA